jgi:hypothetical protein
MLSARKKRKENILLIDRFSAVDFYLEKQTPQPVLELTRKS